MEFTKYFSNLLKEKGVPHLEVEQYQKIFNIMTLEMRMDETNKLLQLINNQEAQAILNRCNYRLYSKKHNLIGNKTPEDIIQEITIGDF